jgi:hypothetical protein
MSRTSTKQRKTRAGSSQEKTQPSGAAPQSGDGLREKEWEAEDGARQAHHDALSDLLRKRRAPFVKLFGQDRGAVEAALRLRELKAGRPEPPPPAAPPEEDAPAAAKDATARSTVVEGSPTSTGGTVVAPYPYIRQPANQKKGDATLNKYYVNSSGQMLYQVSTGHGSEPSSYSINSGLGFVFRPATTNGLLKVWTNIAHSFWWKLDVWLEYAYTDGWVGLFIEKVNKSTGQAVGVFGLTKSLWKVSEDWYDEQGSASNSSYALSTQLDVDNAHDYRVYVGFGGYSRGEGYETFTHASADASLSVTVPSINWGYYV